MDALAALSLASTLMHFADYGSQLLSQAPQSYRSAHGTLTDTIDVEVLILDLLSLKQSMKRRAPPRCAAAASDAHNAENGKALQALYERCINAAQDMLAQLAKLKSQRGPAIQNAPQRSALPDKWRGLLGADSLEAMDRRQQPAGMHFRNWSSFNRRLRAVCDRLEMEALEDSLWAIRRDVQFRMLVSFRGALCRLASQRSQTSHELRKLTTRILDSFYEGDKSFTSQMLLQSQQLLRLDESAENDDDDDAFSTPMSDIIQSIGSFQAPEDIILNKSTAADTRLENEVFSFIIDTCVLDSLTFATMVDRRESVEKAHARTFDWIYKDAGAAEVPWSNYLTWLRHGDGICWINGKVGCGKSTLMRYLYENKTTQHELETWASGRPCDLYSFFFWNSGDEDQKSQLGLLKSLLFDLLQRHRSLIPQVMPDVWKTWSVRVKAAMEGKLPYNSSVLPPEPSSLSLLSLKKIFKRVLESLGKSTKVCFFIDGLDEYGAEHLDIVKLVNQCALLPNIKLCLSSRPWRVFEESFAGFPTLRLQDLTHGDLCHYVRDSLYSQPLMQQMSSPQAEDVSKLIQETVTKSQGVFLWVKLVVRLLVHGLAAYNDVADLQRRVQRLPTNIDELFAHMLAEKDYQRASQIMQIFQAARKRSPEKITLLQLAFADDQDEHLAEEAPMQKITLEEKASRCQEMNARLQGICAGLLESHDVKYSSMAPDGKVMFLHRTVSDWIAKPDVWEELVSQTAATRFSPSLALLKSYIMLLKGLDVTPERPFDMGLVVHAVQYAKDAETELNAGFPEIFDQLDSAAAYQWRLGDCHAVYGSEIMSDTSSDTEKAQSEGADSLSGSPSHLTTYLQSYRESMIENQDGIFGTLNLGTIRSARKSSAANMTFTENALAASYIAHTEARFGGRTKEQPQEATPTRGTVATTYDHWTWGLEIPGLIPMHKATTFYDAARLAGMKHYVASKDSSANVLDQDVGQHMLIRAVLPPTPMPDTGLEPELVERLLAGGADPNFAYQGPTPWQAALAAAAAHFAAVDGRDEDDLSPQFIKGCENWIAVLDVFLRHDADPYAVGKVQNVQDRPQVSVCTVLESYVPGFLEDRGLALMGLLEEKREEVDRKRGVRQKKSPGFDIERKTQGSSVEWPMSWIPIRNGAT
ncbi:hypothetical protein PWT90_04365 [Aphanocladium album]|nr:hypothetical protein PWT90_04365 [Aphanocladium album]